MPAELVEYTYHLWKRIDAGTHRMNYKQCDECRLKTNLEKPPLVKTCPQRYVPGQEMRWLLADGTIVDERDVSMPFKDDREIQWYRYHDDPFSNPLLRDNHP
jgi:hypothetical protein